MGKIDMGAEISETEGCFLLPTARFPEIRFRKDAADQTAKYHKRETYK